MQNMKNFTGEMRDENNLVEAGSGSIFSRLRESGFQ